MSFKYNMKVIDRIEIVVRDKNGKIKSKRVINNGFFHRMLCKLGLRHNSMVQNGLAACAALIGNVSGAPAAFQYIGIGTGTTAASSTDVWLQSATSVQSASSITRVTTTFANDTLQLVYTFGSGAGGGSLTGTASISEVIAANGSGTTAYTASGTNICMLRQVYSPVDVCNFTQGDTIQITIKVQCKQGA